MAILKSAAFVSALTAIAACSASGDGDQELLDAKDSSFSGPKADGFCADPGSPEALGILQLVNDPAVTISELDRADNGADLHKTAAENIVAERPFASLAELDEVSFVGSIACDKLKTYACDELSLCDAPTAGPLQATLAFTYFGENDVSDLEALDWNVDDPFEPFFDQTVELGALPQTVTVLDGPVDTLTVFFAVDGTVSADFDSNDSNAFAAVQLATRSDGSETHLDVTSPIALFLHGNDNSQFSIDGSVTLAP